jgi:CDP-glucose 4,6-dehydratase
MFDQAYRGRRVLVTGHTGFKGSWLTFWLLRLGAQVAGFAVDVPSTPSNFDVLALKERIRHYQGDIRDRAALGRAMDEFQPEIVFHLAAQALVRQSYAEPAATFETNTFGTLNLLECLRVRPGVQAAVLITSDKAYRNAEWCWGYREEDALGGKDPYSGSKGAAELIAYSYYHSFLKDGGTRMATTRAGNVVGGGDWALDRIVPDCIRAWARNEPVMLRNPSATRPWQHVLEPLSGYLALGARLCTRSDGVNGESFNFGPDANVNQTVSQLLQAMSMRWPGRRWEALPGNAAAAHEATLLKLCCDKALHVLGWHAALDFEETVAFTADWYRAYYGREQDMHEFTSNQIDRYCEQAGHRGLAWVS